MNGQLCELDAAAVVDAVGQLTVMIEQVPFALVFHDGVVGGPAKNGFHDPSFVGEGAVRLVSFGVHQVVGGAGGVGKIILSIILVHPGTLEVAAVLISGGEGLAVLVQDLQVLRFGLEVLHIRVQFGKHRPESRFVAFRTVGVGVKASALPHFQLAAPQAAVVDIGAAVIIHEHGGVNAVASGNVIVFRLEGTGRIIRHGYAEAEDAVLVTGREIQVILAVFVSGVRSPHLLADPWNILHVQGAAVIHAGSVQAVHGQDVVVFHPVFITVVVVFSVMGNVVGGVDIDLSIKYMGGRIRSKDMGDQGAALLTHGNSTPLYQNGNIIQRRLPKRK